jgi:hypothetical protein
MCSYDVMGTVCRGIWKCCGGSLSPFGAFVVARNRGGRRREERVEALLSRSRNIHGKADWHFAKSPAARCAGPDNARAEAEPLPAGCIDGRRPCALRRTDCRPSTRSGR